LICVEPDQKSGIFSYPESIVYTREFLTGAGCMSMASVCWHAEGRRAQCYTVSTLVGISNLNDACQSLPQAGGFSSVATPLWPIPLASG